MIDFLQRVLHALLFMSRVLVFSLLLAGGFCGGVHLVYQSTVGMRMRSNLSLNLDLLRNERLELSGYASRTPRCSTIFHYGNASTPCISVAPTSKLPIFRRLWFCCLFLSEFLWFLVIFVMNSDEN